MNILYTVGTIVLVYIAFQYFMILKVKAKKGKEAPELFGKYGKAVESGEKAVFYFYSDHCGACRAMTPVIEEYSKKNPNYFKVDVQTEMDIARKFGVMGTPSTVIVENGKISDFIVGAMPTDRIHMLLG